MINAVNVPIQLVGTGDSVLFSSTRVMTGCAVRHEAGSGRFVVLKPGIYRVTANADIAVPTGGTVGPISIGLSQDGEGVIGAEGTVTPTVVDAYFNVAITSLVRVYGPCGNSVVSLVNTSDIDINVENASIVIDRLS